MPRYQISDLVLLLQWNSIQSAAVHHVMLCQQNQLQQAYKPPFFNRRTSRHSSTGVQAAILQQTYKPPFFNRRTSRHSSTGVQAAILLPAVAHVNNWIFSMRKLYVYSINLKINMYGNLAIRCTASAKSIWKLLMFYVKLLMFYVKLLMFYVKCIFVYFLFYSS